MNKQRARFSSQRRTIWGLLIVLLCSAGTPGDIGGCGQPVQDLDAPVFFNTKKSIDCENCQECEISSKTCDESCNGAAAQEQRFPDGCFPLVHDGAVCLRALLHASCDDYERFVSDTAAETPSECNFCPLELEP